MDAVLDLRNIDKWFGGTRALREASLCLSPGKVVGLIGANGAGKSTLVNVASGRLQPDIGEVYFKGQLVRFRGPRDALRRGISSVPQEIVSLANLTVADSVVLGAEPSRRSPIYSQWMRARLARCAMDRIGVEIDPNALMRDLSASEQRLVSFASVLHRQAEVVFLDEPTAAMGVEDVRLVLRTIQMLSGEGVSIVLISHRFSEILAVCDEVHAMRNGTTLWNRPRTELSVEDLVGAVTSDTEVTVRPEPKDLQSSVVLEAVEISGQGFEHASFELYEGEVLGFTGLVGSGVDEILEAVGGAKRIKSGQLFVQGRKVKLWSPASALRHGIGQLVPERARSGFLGLTVRSNASLSAIGEIGRFGVLTRRLERRYLQSQMQALNLEQRVEEPLASLSGGNRQKVLLSRSVLAGAKILVLGDPTAGVDVGARASIHLQLRELARQGKSVIVSATEPEELLGVADRIIVMANGRIVGSYPNEQLDALSLMTLVATVGHGDDSADEQLSAASSSELLFPEVGH